MFLFISWSRRSSTGRFNSASFFACFLSLSHFQNRRDVWHREHRNSIYMQYVHRAFSREAAVCLCVSRVPHNAKGQNSWEHLITSGFTSNRPVSNNRNRCPHWSRGHPLLILEDKKVKKIMGNTFSSSSAHSRDYIGMHILGEHRSI